MQGQSTDAIANKGHEALNKAGAGDHQSLSGQAKGAAEELRSKAQGVLGKGP